MKTVTIYYAGLLSRAGGVAFHARNLERELRRIGWSVEIITLDSLPIWFRYLPHFVAKTVNLVHSPFGILYKDLITKMMYKYFFNNKVDLRIFEDIYLTWNSSVPTITVLHAVWGDNLQAYDASEKRQKKFRAWEARLINEIAHPLVTVSVRYRDYVNEVYFKGALTKNIGVVELGINQAKFNRFRYASHEKKSVVYCGSLEARKNVIFLLNVFKKVYSLDSEYKLTIIGDGPDKNQLKKYADECGLPVNFLGRLPNEEVLIELHKHELYVHTSVKESFSYALLEAKMAGLITFAYAKLEVPSEFIDVGFESFSVDDWSSKILNINQIPCSFDGSKFTAERMTKDTLSLIPG